MKLIRPHLQIVMFIGQTAAFFQEVIIFDRERFARSDQTVVVINERIVLLRDFQNVRFASEAVVVALI
ncbi:hypothetical protein [Hoeflea sp.]|uniref:hypothetical protein n=1 Tax=Hoeflea sp. TaxID=1940281 RepID=UPI00199B60DC|nr:hypothetical protein [Hoeflea sp.]MBC7282962.1 hypothetical protein [Hoeflea sp.]